MHHKTFLRQLEVYPLKYRMECVCGWRSYESGVVYVVQQQADRHLDNLRDKRFDTWLERKK